jgi:tetratricopeptide (TPR) repeat protein
VDALKRRVVHLAPLTDADIARLAAALLDPATLSPEVEEMILRNAGGNALYAGEFVRLLVDRGALVEDAGVWRMAAGETLDVPGSTQALIAARLDILPPVQRGVLGDAAVVGSTFWAGALAAMGGRPVEQVLEALDSLARRHLVAFAARSTLTGETELRFTHVLVRDGAYAQLTRRDRAEKHNAVARWIEHTSGDRVADVVDILAYHTCTTLDLWPNRAAASDTLRASALRYSALAAERNVTLDTKAAAAHLERALALSENGPGHTHLLALSGQIALQEGRLEEAVDVLERAVTAFRDDGDPRAATRTMIPLAYVYEHLGSARGLELAEEAVELLEDGPSCVELLDALSLSVATRTIGGDPRAGIESAERAFAVAAELGIDRPTMALGYRGLARFYLGDIAGVEDVREAALLGALRGEGRDAAIVYQNLLMLEHIARGPAASLEAQQGALEFASTRGLAEMVTFARMGALDPLIDLGRLEELLVLAGELERDAGEIGSDYVLMYIRAALLRVWAQLGDHARVEEAAEWIEGASRKTGAPEDLVAGIAACAIARYAVGQDEAARALTEELLAAGAGSVWNLAPRLPGLMRAAARAGDIDLARRVLESLAHDSPYARASVASARGVLAEAGGDPAAAAIAYTESARCFERLGVLLEQWLALCGAERALRAAGDAAAAEAAASAAREVCAAMPSGVLLRAGSQAGA